MGNEVFYLVEDFDLDFIPSSANIVSLTPKASFLLQDKGISYSILEDYYEEAKLRAKEKEIFRDQREWISGLDNILKENLDFCKKYNVGIIHAHYLAFKYLVDSVIMQSYIIRNFIDKANPEKVIYVRKPLKDEVDFDIFRYPYSQRNFYGEILEEYSKEKGFKVSFLSTFGQNSTSVNRLPQKNILKEGYFRNILKSLFLFIKYSKYLKLITFKRKNSENNIKILFLHSGCGPLDFLMKKFIHKGADVYFKEGNYIYNESRLFRGKIFDISFLQCKKEIDKLKRQMHEAFHQLCMKGGLFEWVSRKSAIDVTSILKPFFTYFFKNTCMENIMQSVRLVDFYEKNKINFVVARAATDKTPVAGLLASNCLDNVKSVCFQHGCSALDNWVWHITETGSFDMYFATDNLSEEYFTYQLKNAFGPDRKVYQEPFFFKEFTSLKKKSKTSSEKRILYVPNKLQVFSRGFNNMTYPINWYYEFQKKIIDYFGSKKEYGFIFKCAPSQEWASESIIRYIRKKSYPNIEIAEGRVDEYLPKVGKVIMDYPSSPFFEAAAFGVSALTVCKDYFTIWQPAKDYFGKSLQTFSEISEALGAIENFLENDQGDYFIELKINENADTFEIFKNMSLAKQNV